MEVVTETKQGYKKTKIGWIPDEWELNNIGSFAKVKGGKRLPKGEKLVQYDTGYPYIKAGDLKKGTVLVDQIEFLTPEIYKKIKNYIVNTGDVYITIVGAYIGDTGIIPEVMDRANLTENAAKIYSLNSVDNRFLVYFIQSEKGRFQIQSSIGSGAQPKLGLNKIEALKLPIPPLPEQKKIAQILSTWDKAIEQSQNLIEQLKSRKKGLMQQLLTGKTRLKGFSGEWKKYQLGDLATNYNLINKDNKVQEVLSCTKYDGLVRSLEYFGRKVYGDDLSKYKVVPSGYFAYATNHIEEGSIGYQDVLDFGLVSPMYTVFKTNDKVDDSFFYKLLKTDKLIYYYQSNMSGSIARRGGLRWNVFETIVVKIPSIEEQQAIAKVLTTADNEIKTQETYLAQLQAQKKGLMQQLLTGAKRVMSD